MGILNKTLVVVLYTAPFFHSRIISFIGCSIPGPFLPDVRLLVRTSIPIKKILAVTIKIKLTILKQFNKTCQK